MRNGLAVISRSLKKVLLSRVELRTVTILPGLAALGLAALGFGAFMKDGAERSTPRGGALGRVAFGIGSTPVNLYRRFFGDQAPPRVFGQRFHDRSGLTFAPPPPPGNDAARRRSGISGRCAPRPAPGEGRR